MVGKCVLTVKDFKGNSERYYVDKITYTQDKEYYYHPDEYLPPYVDETREIKMEKVYSMDGKGFKEALNDLLKQGGFAPLKYNKSVLNKVLELQRKQREVYTNLYNWRK